MITIGQCFRCLTGHCLGFECDSSSGPVTIFPTAVASVSPAPCAAQQQSLFHPSSLSSITPFCDPPFAVVAVGTEF